MHGPISSDGQSSATYREVEPGVRVPSDDASYIGQAARFRGDGRFSALVTKRSTAMRVHIALL
jgi:hypothetical protein